MTTLVSGIGDFFQKVLRPVSVSFRGEKTYLTLDIGTSSVKMLEIQDTDGALQVMQADVEPLPSNTVQTMMRRGMDDTGAKERGCGLSGSRFERVCSPAPPPRPLCPRPRPRTLSSHTLPPLPFTVTRIQPRS